MSNLSSLSSASVVTLPVLTPSRMYDASAETYVPAIIPNDDGSVYYSTIDSNSNAGNTSNNHLSYATSAGVQSSQAKDNVVCRHCGHTGAAKSEFCFGGKDQKHEFFFQGDKREPVAEKPKKLRCIWKLLLALCLLACYGISVVYIIIPIRKYLEQDLVTGVSVYSATKEKPIPFPGIQVCSFDWNHNLSDFRAFFISPTATSFQEIDFRATTHEDYGYEAFECWEVANYETKKRIQIASKRDKVVIIAKVHPSYGVEISNSDCDPELCDPDLDVNATIRDIDPYNDALGVSIGAFAADGKPKTNVEDDLIYLSAGAYSQVSLSFSRTYRFEQEIPEEAYTMRTSSIRYPPNTYAIQYFGNYSFRMDEVVYAEIGFGQLSFTEVNETKTYEAFNAFGDATAILGFFTGFGVFGGPSFLSLIMDNAHNPCWSSLFYG